MARVNNKVDFDRKEERITKQIEAIRKVYDVAFDGFENGILNIVQFKMDID